VTPTGTGQNLPLSITVNNVHASYLSQDTAGIKSTGGPFPVEVFPGSVSYTLSPVSGVLMTYQAGTQSQVVVTLKDSNNNLMGKPLLVQPTVALAITSGSSTIGVTGVQTTYNNDGTITIYFTPTEPTTGASIEVSVDSQTAPVPSSFINAITIVAGRASAVGTTCTITATTIVAGNSASFTCSIKDSQSNPVTWASMTFQVFMRHRVQPTTIYTATLTGSSAYSGSTVPFVMGNYDYFARMSQPGGLMAFYYSDASFTQIIATSSGLQSMASYLGDPMTWYTQIDSAVNLVWSSNANLGGNAVGGIVWKGYINLQSGTSCKIVGSGIVQVKLGSTIVVTAAASSGAFSSTFTVAANTNNWIEIEYVPDNANPSISLQYIVSSNTMVIPPDYLSASLTVLSFSSATTAITVGATIANAGQSSLSIPTNVVKDQATTVTVTFADVYGNAPTASTCNSIVFSVIDVVGNTIPNAFDSGTATTKTVACSSMTSVSPSFTTTLNFAILADDVTLSALVSWTVNPPATFTLTRTHFNIRDASNASLR